MGGGIAPLGCDEDVSEEFPVSIFRVTVRGNTAVCRISSLHFLFNGPGHQHFLLIAWIVVIACLKPSKSSIFNHFNLLKPTGHVMHQQFNIQQLYVLPTLYLCVLYLSGNKQRLLPLTA